LRGGWKPGWINSVHLPLKGTPQEENPKNKKALISECFFDSILYSTPPRAGRHLEAIYYFDFITSIKL